MTGDQSVGLRPGMLAGKVPSGNYRPRGPAAVASESWLYCRRWPKAALDGSLGTTVNFVGLRW